jgi:hypothetical protein
MLITLININYFDFIENLKMVGIKLGYNHFQNYDQFLYVEPISKIQHFLNRLTKNNFFNFSNIKFN